MPVRVDRNGVDMSNEPVPEAIDIGVSAQIGSYADAVRIPAGHDQIVLSGTPGLDLDGLLANGIVEQATRAWQNVEAILTKTGAGLCDIVAVRQWLISPEDIPGYVQVRAHFITHQTASMLAIIPALVRPEFRIEIEVVAAVAGRS
jgi:2-iminobutanoate/2-iminopropanoate deaminase